jgi:hypothetical protein
LAKKQSVKKSSTRSRLKDAAAFDAQIKLDAENGNLDKIATRALHEHQQGKSRPLGGSGGR